MYYVTRCLKDISDLEQALNIGAGGPESIEEVADALSRAVDLANRVNPLIQQLITVCLKISKESITHSSHLKEFEEALQPCVASVPSLGDNLVYRDDGVFWISRVSLITATHVLCWLSPIGSTQATCHYAPHADVERARNRPAGFYRWDEAFRWKFNMGVGQYKRGEALLQGPESKPLTEEGYLFAAEQAALGYDVAED